MFKNKGEEAKVDQKLVENLFNKLLSAHSRKADTAAIEYQRFVSSQLLGMVA